MKFAVVVLTIVWSVMGEAPGNNFNRQFGFFQRQEQTPAPANGNGQGGAPYPPSGWRPQGAAFTLPARQTGQSPQDNYGAPPPQNGQNGNYGPPPPSPNGNYGPPSNGYGPPPPDSTEQPSPDDGDQDNATTINPQAESVRFGRFRKQKSAAKQVQRQEDAVESVAKNTDRGLYYVYLPDGRLQRVVYMTSADLDKMAYTARVRYEDVDPVSAPIYTSNAAPLPAPASVRAPARFVLQ